MYCGRLGREVSTSFVTDPPECLAGRNVPRIRIYSTKTLKPLGSLDYHKESCQVVIFLRTHLTPSDGADNDDEMDEQEREARGRWVISGGKDGKIVIWELGTFERG